jgi:hypothetical protein
MMTTDLGDLGYQLGVMGFRNRKNNEHDAWLSVMDGPDKRQVVLYADDNYLVLVASRNGWTRYDVRFSECVPVAAIIESAKAFVEDMKGD